MIFDPKKAEIFKAVRKEKHFFRWARALKALFFILFLLFLVLFFFGFYTLGLVLISLSLGIFFFLQETFFESKVKRAKIEKENLASHLDFNLAKAILRAQNFAKAKKIKEVDSTLLFYSLLSGNKEISFIFSRAILGLQELKRRAEENINSLKKGKFTGFSKDFEETLIEALRIAKGKDSERVRIGDAIIALSQKESTFKKILIDFDLRVEDFENIVFWLESLEKMIEERRKFWSKENLVKLGSLGKEWAAGYTITLDKFSVDITKALKETIEMVGHKEDLEKLERVLAREGINNVLLVGEAGTGKKTILQVLAQKSLFGQCIPEINYKRMVFLDIPSLLSQAGEHFEAFLEKIFSEVIRAGNVILVIDEFQNYVGGIRRPGVIDISAVLVKYLSYPEFRLIGITTPQGLHQYIEQNAGLLTLFEKVEVTEISLQESILVLENLAPFFEKKYNKFISYPAIRDIVNFSDRYLPSFSFPKKAIDLLDEAMVYLSTSTREKILLPRHVAKVVSEKTKIPVGEMKEREREILLNLENLIHKRIINQDKAVKEVATAMRRARAEIVLREKPIGVFLFLGPTGVGKTETSKALAEVYFGSEKNMIRLDMSEFQAIEDIPRLLGSREQEGFLTVPIRENPFSLILLDEIEKAHPNILNLFLQVFDEGHITDTLGRKVSFKNSIIIATSNAGYKIILKAIKERTEWSKIKEKLLDYLFEKAIFRPEFINRFDAVVVFNPLTKQNLLDIAGLMLKKLKKNLTAKHIEFEITESLKEKIVELGYSPVFGAREMKRVIQDKVENPLAKALLTGELKRGDKIKMTKSFEIVKFKKEAKIP